MGHRTDGVVPRRATAVVLGRASFLAVAALLLPALGCGPAGGDGDADGDADGDLEPTHAAALPEPPAPVAAEPEPPEAAAEPALVSWACAEGWVAVPHPEVVDGSGEVFSHCEPVRPARLRLGENVTPLDEGEREGARPICDPAVDGTYAVLGSPECEPLGDPCPEEGAWPEVPAEVPGRRVHVLWGAMSGDGSQAAPYGSLGEAVAAAADGDVVVVGPGTYSESVAVARPLTLWGACVARTALVSADPGATGATLRVEEGGDLSVRNLRISGERIGVLVDAEGARAELRGVWVAETREAAVRVGPGSLRVEGVLVSDARSAEASSGDGLYATDGATVEVLRSSFERSRLDGLTFAADRAEAPVTASLEDVLVRDSIGRDSDGARGRGIEAGTDATVVVRRALVERSAYFGIMAWEGCSIDLEDVILVGSGREQPDGAVTGGLVASEGVRLTGRRVAVLDSRTRGLSVELEGTVVRLEDLVVARSRGVERPPSPGGIGIGVQAGAELHVTRGLLEENRAVGLLAATDGTVVELADVVVRETLPAERDGSSGYGVLLFPGSSLVFSRLLVERSRMEGIHAEGARLEGQDLVVAETLPQASDGLWGIGLGALRGTRIAVARARFDGNRTEGVMASDEGTEGVFEDLAILSTRPGSEGTGLGLAASAGARLAASRSRISASPTCGVAAQLAGEVRLEDAVVDGTEDLGPPPEVGAALCAMGGGTVTAARVSLEASRFAGVYAEGERSSVLLEDARVTDTRERSSDGAGGYGAVASIGAAVAMSRAELRGNRGWAVVGQGVGSSVVLEDVVMAETALQASDGTLGIGLGLGQGATGTVRRALIEDSALVGIGLLDPGTSLVAEDVSIRGTIGSGADWAEGGLSVAWESRVEAVRLLVEHVTGIGVGVAAGATAVLTDVTVRGVLPFPSDGEWGRGLHVEAGGRAEVTDGLFERCRDLGVGAFGAGSSVFLRRTSVSGTLEQACAEEGEDPPGCAGRGYGLGSYQGADVLVDQVEVLGSAAVGVQIARGGLLRGSNVEIRHVPVGLNLQDAEEGEDLLDSLSGLVFDRCGVELDERELPLPEAWGVTR